MREKLSCVEHNNLLPIFWGLLTFTYRPRLFKGSADKAQRGRRRFFGALQYRFATGLQAISSSAIRPMNGNGYRPYRALPFSAGDRLADPLGPIPRTCMRPWRAPDLVCGQIAAGMLFAKEMSGGAFLYVPARWVTQTVAQISQVLRYALCLAASCPLF
jgi:hypothetical protein